MHAAHPSFFKEALRYAGLQEKDDLLDHLASCFHDVQLAGFQNTFMKFLAERASCGGRDVPADVAPFMDLDLDSILHLARALPPTLRSLSFLWSWLCYSVDEDDLLDDSKRDLPRMVHGSAVVREFCLDDMSLQDLIRCRSFVSASRLASPDVLLRIVEILAHALSRRVAA